jgi:replicative DNA helicase
MTIKKLGRPFEHDGPDTLKSVTFRADAETLAAIETLVTVALTAPGAGKALTGIKSAAIRRALIEAAERVSETSTTTEQK